jgi:hypothetical protein
MMPDVFNLSMATRAVFDAAEHFAIFKRRF